MSKVNIGNFIKEYNKLLKKFDSDQINEIVCGINSGLLGKDIQKYSNSEYSVTKMYIIKDCLSQGYNIEPYIHGYSDEQFDEIAKCFQWDMDEKHIEKFINKSLTPYQIIIIRESIYKIKNEIENGKKISEKEIEKRIATLLLQQ